LVDWLLAPADDRLGVADLSQGDVYRGFVPLARALAELGLPMVLDGEVVTPNVEGRSRF